MGILLFLAGRVDNLETISLDWVLELIQTLELASCHLAVTVCISIRQQF